MVVLAAVLVGCGAKTPDYQSIWTTTTSNAASAAPTTSGKPVPFSQYLKELGVTGEQVDPGHCPI